MTCIFASAAAIVRDVEALLLPAACLSCGTALPEGDSGCCEVCRTRIRPIAPPVCGRCGQPRAPWETRERGRVSRAGSCGFCAPWPAALAWAASAAWMDEGPARDLVHGLKYGGWRLAARTMADAMVRALGARLAAVDVLVPVPLGRRRERSRGYNQAAVLAEALGAAVGLPVAPLVRRTRETRSQTALGPAARWVNVAGAFAAAGVPPGARVAVVDDVLTTGATLAACAAALSVGAAGDIGAVTFARAAVPH